MARTVAINGKFLRVPTTGVHRVAAELAQALGELEREGHEAVAGLRFELWLPHDGVERARDIDLPRRIVGPLTGIAWEQLTLPLRKGDALVLNLCNIGPVLSRDAVTMIHDVQVHLSPESYGRGFRAWYRMVQPAFARRHRQLLTVSDFSRREIAAVGLAPAERIAVIHNGVDHILRTPPDAAILARLGLAPCAYVLALSSTQAHKNIGLLLRARAALGEGAPPLVLFGGAGRDDFRRAGHAVPEGVIFAGRVDDGELNALMADALCLAFPSTTEGFGLPPLEAMRLGCPAIVAPCGALPEVCGDAVAYADPHDPAAWATAMRRMASDADWRAALARAGQHRSRRFTWRAAAIVLGRTLRRADALA
jgi:glycosyltransferase involved in cell wall biosynthesis